MLLYEYVVSLVAKTLKNLPAMQETWVRSLYWEDPLDTHSSENLIWVIKTFFV